MQNELATYRAKSFTAEANKSSIAYEVKRTRAVFDNSLSIPGTNRRGGWRCPPGTRYGGQITDRFGRNCGWGVSRRIANEISDIGERLESVSERRQRRREARVSARRGRPGVVERAAGRIADALETDSPAGETPRRGRERRGPSRRRPNLRDSEQRRMDREIDEPGALRTGQSRRRRATTEVVDRPRPPAPVAEPAKKVPAKKKAAKKKAVAKKAPAKKVPAKKAPAKKNPYEASFQRLGWRQDGDKWVKGNWEISVNEDGDLVAKHRKTGEIIEQGRADGVSTADHMYVFEGILSSLDSDFPSTPPRPDEPAKKPAKKKPAKKAARSKVPAKLRLDSDDAANSERMRQARADRERGAGEKVDLGQVMDDDRINEYLLDVINNGRLEIINDRNNFGQTEPERFRAATRAEAKISQAQARLERIQRLINRGDLADNDYLQFEVDGERFNIANVKTRLRDNIDAWEEVLKLNKEKTPKNKKPIAPDAGREGSTALNGIRQRIADGKRHRSADFAKNTPMTPEELKKVAGLTAEQARQYDATVARSLAEDKEWIKRYSIQEIEGNLRRINIDAYRRALNDRIKELRDNSPTATMDEIVELQRRVSLSNASLREAIGKQENFNQRLKELRAKAKNPDSALRDKIRAAGVIVVGDTPLNADQLLRFGGVLEADFNGMQERIQLGKNLLARDMKSWTKENIAELRAVVAGTDREVKGAKRDLKFSLERMRTLGPNASDSDFQRLKADVIAANINYAQMINRRQALTDRLEKLGAPKEESAPEPIDGLRVVFAGRRPGFERDWDAERRRVSDMAGTFVNLDEDAVTAKIRDINQNLDYNREYLNNLTAMNPEQRIQLPNRVVKAGDLKDEVQGVVDAWQGAKDAANDRLIRINSNRLPGLAGQRIFRGQNIDGFGTVEIAERQFNELLTNNPDTRFNLINHNGRFYAVSQSQLDNARLNGLNNPTILKTKGGLPLANELPPVDAEVARQAKERVDKAIKQRQDVLAGYLDKRYGSGNAPWKEMTAERRIELAQRAAQGDSTAKRELREWAKAMYSHDEIEGKNGKTYRIVATPTVGSQSIKIVSQIQRKQADGTWLDVGGSERTIYHNAVPAHVYNNSMFINVAEDKNAGIQTIYNQHAWMYAQASGFEYISVSAVQDGPYVWGRVGFTEEIRPTQISAMNAQVANFRDGQGNSIVKNETDARILEHLIGEYIRNPRSVRHADFILALTIEGSPAEKKEREKELRDWFVVNMQFGSGKLNLNDNKISADPRERVRT
jgi:hypothetical protein